MRSIHSIYMYMAIITKLMMEVSHEAFHETLHALHITLIVNTPTEPAKMKDLV